MRHRGPDPAELDLWRRAVRDVNPLRQQEGSPPPVRRRPAERPGAPAPVKQPAPGGPSTSPAAAQARKVMEERQQPLDSLAGIDRASALRLRRGRREIEARLDLHGMTQTEAHAALLRFVEISRLGGRRCVLVITGRGSFGGGVLKQAVPRWLVEPGLRSHVLATAPAQPRHGGSGALYLLLRRIRIESNN